MFAQFFFLNICVQAEPQTLCIGLALTISCRLIGIVCCFQRLFFLEECLRNVREKSHRKENVCIIMTT